MLRKLALAGASLVLVTMLLELVVRVAGVELHDFVQEQSRYRLLLFQDGRGGYFRHPADAGFRLHGVAVRFNSLGLRDEEPRIPKPPGAFRILCLGDSMVFGPGVAQDEIFPARLRALFAGDGIEVVAAGVQGWNTGEEERFLATNLERLAPDLIALLYVTNDNDPTPPWQGERAPARRLRDVAYRELVLHSRLFEWVAFLRARARETAAVAPPPANAAAPAGPAVPAPAREPAFSPRDPGWLESRAALGRMAALARNHDARLAIWLYDMTGREPAPTALERLRELGAEAGVPVFETRPYFAGHDFASIVNRPIVDPHPNAAGHALLAAGIARTLRAEGLVPVRPAGGT